MVSTMACSLMGSTIPEVPRTDSPPSMPSRGLKVRRARSAPPGMETITSAPPAAPAASSSACTASAIIRRGTRLMAAAPTGWSRPGLVTRPTPSPPSMHTPGAPVRRTDAHTSIPSVTSASSPASLRTAQRAVPSAASRAAGSTSTGQPLGVRRHSKAGRCPVSSSLAAPAAANAAQVPVV